MLVKLKLPGILEDMRVSEIVVEVPLTLCLICFHVVHWDFLGYTSPAIYVEMPPHNEKSVSEVSTLSRNLDTVARILDFAPLNYAEKNLIGDN